MYVISSGSNYLAHTKTGSIFITQKIDAATHYPESRHAANALAKMPRSVYAISSKWAVTKCDDKPPEMSSPPKTASPQKNDVPYSDDCLLNLYDELAAFDAGKEMCKQQLVSELSVVDQEVSDLYHFIEFNELNACNGYKAYKMLHDTLLVRRKIKNKLYIIDQLTQLCGNAKISEWNNTYHNKTYEPRQLAGLFKNT